MKFLALFLTGIGLLVLFSALFAVFVMLVWNAVVPDVFGLPQITFIQAWLLSLLAGFLFKDNTVKVNE